MQSRFPILAALLAAAACSPGLDRPLGPDTGDPLVALGAGQTVPLCHRAAAGPRILTLPAAALADHLAHGDYPTTLIVDPGHPSIGNGRHFGLITDALDAARTGRLARGEATTADCRITIAIAAGIYDGLGTDDPGPGLERFPLVVDVPDITLRGAFVAEMDDAGRATGVAVNGDETVLNPVAPLPNFPTPCAGGICSWTLPLIIANAHPGGSAGHGLVIEGLVLRSGNPAGSPGASGQGVFGMRVNGLVIRGNRFEGGFTESIDLRAGDAVIERNHLGGGGGTCDICVAGPGDFTITGNRLLAGGVPGILTAPTILIPVPPGVEQYDLPAAALLTAAVVNNEVRDHQRVPAGVGIRVTTVARGGPNVAGMSRVRVQDNLLVNNRFGLFLEAAFPVNGTLLLGDAELTLGGNIFQSSCQADLLVTFTRHVATFGLAVQPYVRNSTYEVTLNGDLEPGDIWYGHPAGFDNTLVVDGVPFANGIVHAYDAAKVCAP
jgi:hypothetical protein